MKENKPHLRQEQLEKLKELGCYLRQCRREQSMSLDEVAAITRIQARLLNAIEEGKLEELPEPVYIKGFIKRFADALGLNGAEFANTFPTGTALQFMKPSWRNLPAAQLRPFHLYLLYVLLVVCAVSGLSLLVRRSAVQVIQLEDYPQPAANLPQQPSSLKKLASVSTPVKPRDPNKPVQVDITLESRSWIRVVADGKTQFEDVLEEGTQRTWVANQQLTIRAGNAGGVLVEFNNEIAKRMGAPGEVEEVTFAANPKS
ncbi:MAG: RodZ domain-containing protein [Coleofasciculaceae cyanobacterium]